MDSSTSTQSNERPNEENETFDKTNSTSKYYEDDTYFLKTKKNISSNSKQNDLDVISITIGTTNDDNDSTETMLTAVTTDWTEIGTTVEFDEKTITEITTTMLSVDVGENITEDTSTIMIPITTNNSKTDEIIYFEIPLNETSTKSYYHVFDTAEYYNNQSSNTTVLNTSTEPNNTSSNTNQLIITLACFSTIICVVIIIGIYILLKKKKTGKSIFAMRCRPITFNTFNVDDSIFNSFRQNRFRFSKRSMRWKSTDDVKNECPSRRLNADELMKALRSTVSIDAEFEKIPKISVSLDEVPEGCEDKNRYANVIPLSETRVRISTENENDEIGQYINANYVTGYGGVQKYYIACQAPLKNTLEDFWRMAWENNTKVIIMLTKTHENMQEKCANYLPISEAAYKGLTFNELEIRLKKREFDDKWILSHLEIKHLMSNSSREIIHFSYTEWPERGIPSESKTLIAILLRTNAILSKKMRRNKSDVATRSNRKSITVQSPQSSLIVHCSSGTGRTGAVIAIDMAIQEYMQMKSIDIPKIVAHIRKYRARSVETKEQYAFIYKTMNYYINKFNKDTSESSSQVATE